MTSLFETSRARPPGSARSRARQCLLRLSLAIGIGASLCGGAAAQFPIQHGGVAISPTGPSAPVALTGWNKDFVADANSPSAAGSQLDKTTFNFSNFVLHEERSWGGITGSGKGLITHLNDKYPGLPSDGKLKSVYSAKVEFQLQPAAGNNVLVVNGDASATLELGAPKQFHSLQFLHASEGSGGTTVSVTLNFSDGSATTLPTVASTDWRSRVNSNAIVNLGVATPAGESCEPKRGGGKICTQSDGVKRELRHLNQTDHTLSGDDRYKFLKSVTFKRLTGGPLVVLAITGTDTMPAPSADVAGANISSAELGAVLGWIQREYIIDQTPFCYKQSYDRGVGILPGCGSGKEKVGALCYDDCRSGYKSEGLFCAPTGSLSYMPGRECTRSVPVLGCVASKPAGCRSGYTDVAGVCWRNAQSYGRGVGSEANECLSNRQMQAGLCYLTPKSDYTCTATGCLQNCASGLVACGAACAKDANTCASSIANMVVSPAILLANIATAGAAGRAKAGMEAAAKAYTLASTAAMYEQAAQALNSAIEDFMAAAEKDLASVSSADIESQVAAKYGKGSANYRKIARHWAHRQLQFAISAFLKDIATFVVTVSDPTGVASVIDAFAQPPCTQRTKL